MAACASIITAVAGLNTGGLALCLLCSAHVMAGLHLRTAFACFASQTACPFAAPAAAADNMNVSRLELVAQFAPSGKPHWFCKQMAYRR